MMHVDRRRFRLGVPLETQCFQFGFPGRGRIDFTGLKNGRIGESDQRFSFFHVAPSKHSTRARRVRRTHKDGIGGEFKFVAAIGLGGGRFDGLDEIGHGFHLNVEEVRWTIEEPRNEATEQKDGETSTCSLYHG